MTPNQYFLLAFVITMLLLVGYPLYMWMEHRSLARQETMARHAARPRDTPSDPS